MKVPATDSVSHEEVETPLSKVEPPHAHNKDSGIRPINQRHICWGFVVEFLKLHPGSGDHAVEINAYGHAKTV